MVAEEWQYSYAGLTLGDDEFGVIKVEGLDPPEIRADIVEKAEDHGSYVFARYSSHRTIIFEGDLLPDDDFEGHINDLRTAFSPKEENEALVYLIGDTARRIYCKPVRTSFPIDRDYSLGYGRWMVQLVAEDPRIYSDEIYSETLLPFLESGMTFPVTFDLSFGGGTGGEASIVNAGGVSSPVVTRIDGPVTNPKITNSTVDKFLRVDVTLGATDYLELDHLARTVLLNGSGSRYSQLTADSEWWELEVGTNSIRFDGTSTGGSTKATITWRDSWL